MADFVSIFLKPDAASLAAVLACAQSMTTFKTKPTTA